MRVQDAHAGESKVLYSMCGISNSGCWLKWEHFHGVLLPVACVIGGTSMSSTKRCSALSKMLKCPADVFTESLNVLDEHALKVQKHGLVPWSDSELYRAVAVSIYIYIYMYRVITPENCTLSMSGEMPCCPTNLSHHTTPFFIPSRQQRPREIARDAPRWVVPDLSRKPMRRSCARTAQRKPIGPCHTSPFGRMKLVHARPLRQRGKGDLELPNLRHVRCAPLPLGR